MYPSMYLSTSRSTHASPISVPLKDVRLPINAHLSIRRASIDQTRRNKELCTYIFHLFPLESQITRGMR